MTPSTACVKSSFGMSTASGSRLPRSLLRLNRDQHEAVISHAREQAVQRGLVGYHAGDGRDVVLPRDRHAFKQLVPSRVEVAFHLDFVKRSVQLFLFNHDSTNLAKYSATFSPLVSDAIK